MTSREAAAGPSSAKSEGQRVISDAKSKAEQAAGRCGPTHQPNQFPQGYLALQCVNK
ncbi:hypothetical protein ACFQT0_03365 [Hymenobacter humi]|uniref:Uncharacterized protein n=1 Tax=Hymenobacter humi TaxID=1411620 RepID=A0ABW2U0W8_9BACT